LYTLFEILLYFETLFIASVYKMYITHPSLSEAVGVRFTAKNIKDFNTSILRSRVINIIIFFAP
jgi:hypothetical protein